MIIAEIDTRDYDARYSGTGIRTHLRVSTDADVLPLPGELMKPRRGQRFEELVTSIYKQLGPDASVEHDQKIVDRLGHARQFDVVVRGQFAGSKVLGVVECRDTRRKVDVGAVEAFITKSQEVSANFRILCSRNGFTEFALEKARNYGIEPISLISEQAGAPGVLVGSCWYASVYRWGRVTITLRRNGVVEPEVDAALLSYEGALLSSWISNHLACHHRSEQRLGWVLQLSERWPTVVTFHCGEREIESDELTFTVERLVSRHKKLTLLRGRGTYNWAEKTATFPAGATIASDGVTTDFELWEPWDGSEKADSSLFQCEIVTHSVPNFVEGHSPLDQLLGDPREPPRESDADTPNPYHEAGIKPEDAGVNGRE